MICESEWFSREQEAENLLVVMEKVKENCRESGIGDCSDEEACFTGIVCRAHKTAWARWKTGEPQVPSSTDNTMKRPRSVLSPPADFHNGGDGDQRECEPQDQVVITDRELAVYIQVVHAITNEALMGGDVSLLLAVARTAVTTAARDEQEARARLVTEKANRCRLKVVHGRDRGS